MGWREGMRRKGCHRAEMDGVKESIKLWLPNLHDSVLDSTILYRHTYIIYIYIYSISLVYNNTYLFYDILVF